MMRKVIAPLAPGQRAALAAACKRARQAHACMSTTNVVGSAAAPAIASVRYADFRSDTVTKPTAQMTIAMIDAQVGDDVYGEDPTVNQLEALGAQMLGKEAAVYVPTTTMANLISIGAWINRGDEVLLGDESHIMVYEQGGTSWLMGGIMRTLPNAEDGTFALTGRRSVAEAIATRPDDPHYARIGAVTIENTHNRCGGAVLPLAWIDDLSSLCKEHGLPIHMDGARLMNAAAASGVKADRIARNVDSVSLCLSKGLGAPAGSLVIGSKEFVSKARRLRKAVGGGMRQAGVIAASGIVALKEHVGKLPSDHAKAKSLARGLANIPGLVLDPTKIGTNIVFFDLDLSTLHADNLAAKVKRTSTQGQLMVQGPGQQAPVDVAPVLAAKGKGSAPPTTASVFGALLESLGRVRVGAYGTHRLRAVTHHQVSDADVDRFLDAAAQAAALLRK